MFSKRFFLILMASISTVLFCGASIACSKSSNTGSTGVTGDAAKKYRIGVVLNHTQDVFMKNLESGFIDEAAKYPELEMKLLESGMDPVKQLSQVEQLISEKVDIIVLNPANQESSAIAVETAADAGIPIFTVNTTTTPEAQAKCLTYVGSDAMESGRIQCRYVAETVLKGSGKVAYMNASMGHQAQIDRYTGTMEIFNKYPNIEIVLEGSGEWRTDKAVALTENWLQSGRQFDVIVCQGADMAFGAVLALKDAGKNGQIKVSGIDISNESAKELLDGNISNLVFQDAKGQGEAGLKTALKILKGEKVSTSIDIPYELITTENCSNYDGRY
jgi:inositol transport system substrate-binding protein